MTETAWLIIFTFLIVGMIYTYYLGKGLAEKKVKEKLTVTDVMEEVGPFGLACFMVFGPFVIVVRRIVRKARGK